MDSRIPKELSADTESDPAELVTVVPPPPATSEVRLLGAISEPVTADLARDPRAERKVV